MKKNIVMFSLIISVLSHLDAAPFNFFDTAHALLNMAQEKYTTLEKKLSKTDTQAIGYGLSGADALATGLSIHTILKRLSPYTKRPVVRLVAVFGAGAAIAAVNHNRYENNSEHAQVIGAKGALSFVVPAMALRTLKVGVFPAALYTAFSLGTAGVSYEELYQQIIAPKSTK